MAHQMNADVLKTYVWNDFRYVIHRRREETTYYICELYQKGLCRARGIEKNGNFYQRDNHMHLPNYRQLKIRYFKQDLGRRANDLDERFRLIYNATRPVHTEAAVNAPFVSCARFMYRCRSKTWPPKPQDLRSYTNILNLVEFRNWKDYNGGSITVSLVVNPHDLSKSVVFIDVAFAEKLLVHGAIFVDATFKIVPKNIGCRQFLTFMAIRYDHALPFAWALMERKTEAAYVAVIRELRRLWPNMIITEAMTDYEPALKSALRSEFPLIILYSCLFHYDQALYKKAVKLRLKLFLNANEECRHVLRRLMSLAFLPPIEIRQAYNEIVNDMNQNTLLIMQQFLNYYELQWLQHVQPENFSIYGLIRRTNNVLEAYHKTLVTNFEVHPNIWNFTKRLVKYQEGLLYDLGGLKRGHELRRLPRLSNVIKQRLIMTAWQQLHGPNRPSRLEFLETIIRISIDPIVEFLRVA